MRKKIESLEENVANWIKAQSNKKAWHGEEYIPAAPAPLTREQTFQNKLRQASKDSMFHEGYHDDFAEVDQQDLKLNYPRLYEKARLKNIDANNSMQERIAFDMDRFRDESDPWTQAGMKQLEYISSVPMGFENQEMINPEGGSARGMTAKGPFKRPRIYAYGGKLDPYTLAHEGRHSVVRYGSNGPGGKVEFDLGGTMEESANRLVDYNLAERWGDINKEMETGRFLEGMQAQGEPISQLATMQYQKQFGDPAAFDNEKILDYKLTHESLDKKSANEMNQLYNNANQYENRALIQEEFGTFPYAGGKPELTRMNTKNPYEMWDQLKDLWNK